jgi:uncharacterized protein with PIN domain
MDDFKFIVDQNTGKLARLLRMMGYDTAFFTGEDDGEMVNIALTQDRAVVTRDRELLKRRPVVKGRVRALLVTEDDPRLQVRQVAQAFGLSYNFRPFSLCLECNQPLAPRERDEVKDRVPPYVFQTQTHYMQCPRCGRIYWRGTHWQAMTRELSAFAEAA